MLILWLISSVSVSVRHVWPKAVSLPQAGTRLHSPALNKTALRLLSCRPVPSPCPQAVVAGAQ